MNDSFQPLPQLEITTPCHESWDAMSGSEQSRYCSQCEKSVFNFTEMTSVEVREVLSSNQSICARMRQREDGSIVTRDSEPTTTITRRDWFSQFLSLATMVLAMGTLVGCNKRDSGPVMGGLKKAPEDVMGIMGDVAVGEPPTMGEVCVPEDNAANDDAGTTHDREPASAVAPIQGRVQVAPSDTTAK